MPLENACCPEVGCTNVNSDVHNCGACGFDCMADEPPGPRGDICTTNASGDPTCYCGAIGDVCTGTTWCTNVTEGEEQACGCADLLADPLHCGRCDVQCDENEICREGECLCLAADVDCEGTDQSTCCPGVDHCVDTTRESENCGSCGNQCQPGETCSAGVCRCNGGSGCNETQVCCSGRGCTNVLTDEANCGPETDLTGCGNACNAGVECQDGFCSCGSGGDCGSGETCCFESYCAALQTDPDNCGSCDNECNPGEECVGGNCVCGADCNDGNSCTEDHCDDDRCEHHTLDNDDDGYCGGGCRDQDSGEAGDCINGDCDDNNALANPGELEDCDTSFDDDCDGGTNDIGAVNCIEFYLDDDDDTYGDDDVSPRCYCRVYGSYSASRALDCNDANPSVNPEGTEICNGLDDDCNNDTADGSLDCAGGAAFCCGSPAACRSCCDDTQCSGTHNICNSYRCSCQSPWTDCAGTCNCETGGGQVCCSDICYDGNCCGDGDCTSNAAPDCNTSSHICECIGGLVCGSTCRHGAACCNDADCGGATPNCCSYQCEACCNVGDCGPGDWTCTSNVCTCGGVECGGECFDPGECCDADDCPGVACLADHTCAV